MMGDRPDKSEQKTVRFNMFMSPSEMEAIDEWAWKHRIRSKSEAVRRLIQLGLFASDELSHTREKIIAPKEDRHG